MLLRFSLQTIWGESLPGVAPITYLPIPKKLSFFCLIQHKCSIMYKNFEWLSLKTNYDRCLQSEIPKSRAEDTVRSSFSRNFTQKSCTWLSICVVSIPKWNLMNVWAMMSILPKWSQNVQSLFARLIELNIFRQSHLDCDHKRFVFSKLVYYCSSV